MQNIPTIMVERSDALPQPRTGELLLNSARRIPTEREVCAEVCLVGRHYAVADRDRKNLWNWLPQYKELGATIIYQLSQEEARNVGYVLLGKKTRALVDRSLSDVDKRDDALRFLLKSFREKQLTKIPFKKAVGAIVKAKKLHL